MWHLLQLSLPRGCNSQFVAQQALLPGVHEWVHVRPGALRQHTYYAHYHTLRYRKRFASILKPNFETEVLDRFGALPAFEPVGAEIEPECNRESFDFGIGDIRSCTEMAIFTGIKLRYRGSIPKSNPNLFR